MTNKITLWCHMQLMAAARCISSVVRKKWVYTYEGVLWNYHNNHSDANPAMFCSVQKAAVEKTQSTLHRGQLSL